MTKKNAPVAGKKKVAVPRRDTASAPVGKTPSTAEFASDETMPFPADDPSREDIRLSFLIHDVSRMRRSAYDQFMKPLGITRAQWWVLAYLSRHDGMMQTQLADVLEVGKASLGDVIESLEGSGWVQRRPDPSDKRAKRVYLARAAQPLIKRMTVLENQFNARILSELSAEERSVLARGLSKIKQAISNFAPATSIPSGND